MSKKLLTDKKLIVELIIVLVVKLVFLFVIWQQFFSNSPDLSHTNATADRLLQSPSGEQP